MPYGVPDIVHILIVIRYITVMLFFKPFAFAQKELQLMSFFSARGLAAAVLAPMPLIYGVSGSEPFSDIVFSVIICTVIFTVGSYIYFTKFVGEDLSEKIIVKEKSKKKKNQKEEENKEEENELEDFELIK